MKYPLLALLALSLLLSSCTDSEDPGDLPPDDTGGTITFSATIRPILQSRCQSCHSYLGSYASVMSQQIAVYGSALVIPGNAETSPLYDKVRLDKSPLRGGRMPQGGALSSTQVNAIKTWINEGALNN